MTRALIRTCVSYRPMIDVNNLNPMHGIGDREPPFKVSVAHKVISYSYILAGLSPGSTQRVWVHAFSLCIQV